MPNGIWRSAVALVVSVLASFGSVGAVAADLTLTGFGTVGYARSDQDFQYLRYIDNDGTFKADSLIGIQAEAQFDSQWGATVQAVASAPRTRDDGHEAKVRWAFLSFRPDNEWLIRVGRVRPPVFINTQNAEVGVTYDPLRLPAEVYSLSPVYDFDGGAVTKTWALGNADLSVDAYWGKTNVKFRFHTQNEPLQPYFPERVTVKGLILSHTSETLLLRGGAHHAAVETTGPDLIPETLTATPVPGPPPVGGTLFVPTGLKPQFDFAVLTLGADWRFSGWRLTAEYAQRIVPDVKIAPASKAGYATLARQIGRWTPYLTHARLLSDRDVREVYQGIRGVPVPLAVQGPPLFVPANAHGLFSDGISVYDQYSTMLGVSYRFSATSKLKFEWMRTKVGLVSSLVDGEVHNKAFNVFSASYSVAF